MSTVMPLCAVRTRSYLMFDRCILDIDLRFDFKFFSIQSTHLSRRRVGDAGPAHETARCPCVLHAATKKGMRVNPHKQEINITLGKLVKYDMQLCIQQCRQAS